MVRINSLPEVGQIKIPRIVVEDNEDKKISFDCGRCEDQEDIRNF